MLNTHNSKGENMDIRHLELIIDIADTGNLTASANNMGYTQSGVSHVIKSLEAELGISLLVRSNRGVSLTKDAQTVLPQIQFIINHYRRLMEGVNAINGLESGTVTIGAYSSIAIEWLPAIIKEFQHRYPKIKLQIREGGLAEIAEWMRAGHVDFGLISKVPEYPFEFIPLCTEPLYAVTPANFYQLPEWNNHFPVEEFMSFPYIASDTGVDNDVAATLQEAGISPHVRIFCQDDHSIVSMVMHGLGITLLPSLMLGGYQNSIKKIPLDRCATRTLGIGMISSDILSLADKKFIDVIQELVPTMI